MDLTTKFCNGLLTGTFLLSGALLAAVPASAAVIFHDDFSTGNLSKTLNGATFWKDNSSGVTQPGASGPCTITVKTDKTPVDYSVRAFYAGSPDLSADGRPELRFNLGGQYPELWVSFRLFVPQNYYHRVPTGTGNNKFFIIDNGIGSQYFDFEAWPASNGGDQLAFNSQYAGQAQGHKFPAVNVAIGAPEDRGLWHNYVLHIKLATTATANNGMAQIWKNGKLVMDFQNLPHYTPNANFFSAGYMFGASNSGFNVDTELRLDDVTFATTPPLVQPRWMP